MNASGAVRALATKFEEVFTNLPSWARSKVNRRGLAYTVVPDDYWDHAMPALVAAGHPIASNMLGLMMRLSWGKKGARGESGPEWIPMPVRDLTGLLGSTRNTASINVRALVAAGALEERKSKDRRFSEYRVAVERLRNIDKNSFEQTYDKLVEESLRKSKDVPLDEAEIIADDGAVENQPEIRRPISAYTGPIIRFGFRQIPASQVAQEAHLCTECTAHFVTYAETAQKAPVTAPAAVEVKNSTGANKSVTEKECTTVVHFSPEPSRQAAAVKSPLIARLRTVLSHSLSERLNSAPPEKLLEQIAAKLEAAGADLGSFFARCNQRDKQVKTWGFLLHLADDAASAARVIREAREGLRSHGTPELSPAERIRVHAAERIAEIEAAIADGPERAKVIEALEYVNVNAGSAEIEHLETVLADASAILFRLVDASLSDARRREIEGKAEEAAKPYGKKMTPEQLAQHKANTREHQTWEASRIGRLELLYAI